MARYDKYDGKVGGFRAPLAAAWDAADAGVPTGVGLDANGRIVAGAGNTGVIAVLVLDAATPAGTVVDPMTDGEIVDCEDLDAGTAYYAATADGVVSDTDTGIYVGHTVEAARLVVRVAR